MSSFPTGKSVIELKKEDLLEAALGATKLAGYVIKSGDQKMSFEKRMDFFIGPILIIGKSSDGRVARIEMGEKDGQATINILDPDPETPDE